MPVIGFMSARSPEDSVAVLAAFRRGLGEGLIEGKNVEVQFRWARGDFSRLPALAAELVNQPGGRACRGRRRRFRIAQRRVRPQRDAGVEIEQADASSSRPALMRAHRAPPARCSRREMLYRALGVVQG
jgi:hypothetical protein